MIVLALTKMIIVHVLVIIDDTDIFYYLTCKLHFKVHVYCLEKDNNNTKVYHS